MAICSPLLYNLANNKINFGGKQMNENKRCYTNSVQMMMSELEFRILFGIEEPVIEDGKVVSVKTETVSDIRMNPKLAKQMIGLIQEHVENYEKIFGELGIRGVGEMNE